MLTCLAVHQDVQHRLARHQLQIRGLLWRFPHVAKVRKIFALFDFWICAEENSEPSKYDVPERFTLLRWRWQQFAVAAAAQMFQIDFYIVITSFLMVVITLTFPWTKMWSQRQRNKAFYCNNTFTGMRFIDQQIHTQQPGRCKMCRCGALLNKYLRRGAVADRTAEGGAVFFLSKIPTVCVFTAKAWRQTSCQPTFSRSMKTPRMRWAGEPLGMFDFPFDPLGHADFYQENVQ